MLKTVSSITNAIGALNYKGTWDANANSPALTSSVGTKGDYYVVGTAGSTNLNGITNWGVGDWAAFNGSVWQRVEGGANLNGVDLSVSGTSTLSGLTASTPLALNASKEIVSVVVPAFSAYQSVAQTGVSGSTVTKVTFTTEEFDTNSNFASSTFTPTVAGYYQVNGAFSTSLLNVLPSAVVLLYKNGAAFKSGGTASASPSNFLGASAAALIYMNGSTDYIELYAYVDLNGVPGTYDIRTGAANTYFQASLVRSA